MKWGLTRTLLLPLIEDMLPKGGYLGADGGYEEGPGSLGFRGLEFEDYIRESAEKEYGLI